MLGPVTHYERVHMSQRCVTIEIPDERPLDPRRTAKVEWTHAQFDRLSFIRYLYQVGEIDEYVPGGAA